MTDKTVTAERDPRMLSLPYTNWRGTRAVRHVLPLELWYGKTPYHTEAQWLLKAIDVEKDEERDFALSGFIDQHSAGVDEAVERACRVVSIHAGIDWDTGDEFSQDTIREVQREALTAAGLPALVAECERLRAEVDMLTAQNERQMEQTIVHRGALRYCNSSMRNAYVDETVRADAAESRAEQAEARAVESERDSARMLRALNAALGVGGDFPLRQDGDPPYWWRDWLQKFAGLAYNGKRFVIEQGGGTI